MQFMKLLSLKENFSKISEVKQWLTRSEREKRKELSTFNYSFISLEALQDVRKIQFLTSNRRVSKMCVILLLWNRRRGETVLTSDYSNKVRKYFWKWFLSSWMKNIEKCEKRKRKPLVSWKSPSICQLIPPNEPKRKKKKKENGPQSFSQKLTPHSLTTLPERLGEEWVQSELPQSLRSLPNYLRESLLRG